MSMFTFCSIDSKRSVMKPSDSHAFTTLGYNCTCDSSLLGNGFDVTSSAIVDPDGCTPIQECSDGLHNCDVNAECTQLQPAGFACACKTGFVDTVVNGVVPEPGISCEDQGKRPLLHHITCLARLCYFQSFCECFCNR